MSMSIIRWFFQIREEDSLQLTINSLQLTVYNDLYEKNIICVIYRDSDDVL